MFQFDESADKDDLMGAEDSAKKDILCLRYIFVKILWYCQKYSLYVCVAYG